MAVEVFERLERSRSDIEALYNVTHSLEYQNTLRALEKLSSAIDRIRNVLCNPVISWMGLCGMSEELANSINNATNYMRKVQSISEELHSTAIAMPMVVKLLWIATLAGIAMIGAGTALITRAMKRRG
jgi:fumarate reductase subunit C